MDERVEKVKRELIADLERHLAENVVGTPYAAALDAARTQMERIVGQPCIAHYAPDGQTIIIQTPVIKRR